tara:strand:+ start:725 stop:2677 length:1953 start_codon:yes stop_codon:yes gene_type:complete
LENSIGPDHVYELVTVKEPTISPDGSSVVFTRGWVEKDSLKSHSQLMITATGFSEIPSPFTSGPKDSNPTYSPDGKFIAFIRPDENEIRQIWLISTMGGEAQRLSSFSYGVQEMIWSPDATQIVVVSDVAEDESDGQEFTKDASKVRVVKNIRYREDGLGWRGSLYRQIFVLDVSSGGTNQVTFAKGDHWSPSWSPDGTRIAFVSDMENDRDIEDSNAAYVISSEGSEPEKWSHGLITVERPVWSPCGNKIAVFGSQDPKADVWSQGWIYVLQVDHLPSRVTDDSIKPQAGYSGAASSATRIIWNKDDNLFMVADAQSKSYVYKLSLRNGSAERVVGGREEWSAISFTPDADKACSVVSTDSSPSDIAVVDLMSGEVEILTNYNRVYLEKHKPASVERFISKGNGLNIDCRLYIPPDFDSSASYPLVLTIHGGPHSAYYDDFSPTQQVLATNGYLVLAVNPRGSSTYGLDFMKSVQEDWGGEDFRDIMAAVELVSSRSYVDEQRLGITGYSYGGYMTAWAVGQDHRFNAAVVGAPCIDLTSMYGTSDIGVSFGEIEWGGTRQQGLDGYLKHSPITYADRVNTPVLLLHGEQDLRCPISQSEQYFVALRRARVHAEFVRFPECSHGFLRSGPVDMRREYFSRMLDWFNRYL